MRYLAALLLALLLVAPAAAADAERRFTISMERNTELEVDRRMAWYDHDCSPLGFSIKTTTPPRHGEVRYVKADGNIGRSPRNWEITMGSGYGHCRDKPTPVTKVLYRPAQGFVGQDRIVYDVHYEDNIVITFILTLKVEAPRSQ